MTRMPQTLQNIADAIGATVHGDPNVLIERVGDLESTEASALAFCHQAEYLESLKVTSASAVIVREAHKDLVPSNALVVDDPYLAYAKAANLIYPKQVAVSGIHKSASIAESAVVSPTAEIAANVVIGERAEIGNNVIIGANVVIGANVTISDDTIIRSGVVIYDDISVGKRCLFHAGVVIGSDGFGFANERGVWIKIPHIGRVEIGDDVEVGANTTIDRATQGVTKIGNGVKLDNQIQVGHNAEIGDHTAIAGCVAIAGSAKIGRFCMIGGSSAIAGHITICDGVQLTGQSGIGKSIDKPGLYSSSILAEPARDSRRKLFNLASIDQLKKRLKVLEKQISK